MRLSTGGDPSFFSRLCLDTMSDNPMNQVTHIFFDFFGTLVEYSDSRTEQGYERSHAFLLSNGADLDYRRFLDTWSATFHKLDVQAEASHDEYSMQDLVRVYLPEVLGRDVKHDEILAFVETYLQEWNKGVKHIEGVAGLLNQLAATHTLALVTNTHSAELVGNHLREMGVADSFSAIVTSVEHGKRKPDCSIFEHALKITGGATETALYIGDSFATDYIGANRTGMRCLLVDPDKRQDVPEEDRLSTVLDLPRILKRAR